MPLRLFGGRGRANVRACPACGREVADAAAFCPSCYMLFRAEGAAELREFLRGARIPSDVYLLRKMQAEDPDLGPVIREAAPQAPSPPQPPPPLDGPAAAPPPPETPAASPGSSLPASGPTDLPAQAAPALPAMPPAGSQSKAAGRTSIELLLTFDSPIPPATRTVDDVPALFNWMLDHDPVIPNNLLRLEAIHAGAYRDRPAGRLRYEEHILLQAAEDLLLHPSQEALDEHMVHLVRAYRQAAEAYHAAPEGGQSASEALWRMASAASRLRLEGWIYRSRYGAPPTVAMWRGPLPWHGRDRRRGRPGKG